MKTQKLKGRVRILLSEDAVEPSSNPKRLNRQILRKYNSITTIHEIETDFFLFGSVKKIFFQKKFRSDE